MQVALDATHAPRLVFAGIVGAVTMFWFGDPRLSLVIAAAMVVNMVVAGFSGILIPLGLDRIGVDPAIAATVLLTTVTDVVGFLAFLAFRHGLRLSLRGPLLALMATLTGLVGLSRVFLSAHWPTDVAAGYLLGAILLLLLIPLYGVCVRAICTEGGGDQTGLRTAAG